MRDFEIKGLWTALWWEDLRMSITLSNAGSKASKIKAVWWRKPAPNEGEGERAALSHWISGSSRIPIFFASNSSKFKS